MDTILWQPTQSAIAASNMMHFIHYVNSMHGLRLANYPSLYGWSIEHKDLFWRAIVDFSGIQFSQREHQVIKESFHMQHTKWFVGAKLNFAENLLRHTGDRDALVFRNENNHRRTVSWDELRQTVGKLIYKLRQAGIVSNDRVAAVMPNMPETIMALLAITSLGAIFSSCSPDFGVEAIVERFSQIEPKILFISDGHFYNGKAFDAYEKIVQLVKQLPTLEKIVVIPYLNKSPMEVIIPKAILWDHFIENAVEELEFTQLPFDHPVYIMFSSGTTGLPKCIVHGAGGTLLQHVKELMLHTDLKPRDRIFYYTTCGWMMWNWYISSLALGATVIQYDGSPFYPRESQMFDLIDDENITVFGTSAKFISSCEKLHLSPKTSRQLRSLRTILSTGSPLVPKNYAYVYEKIKKNLCLSSISGGTDIISCFALGNPILPVYAGELQCIGLGMNVEIYNEEAKSVLEEKGELVCTASFPSMPIYFWNDPKHIKYTKAYFEKFPNVWCHGDYAEITKHGGVIIYGRSDTTLNASGIRIGTAEIYRQIEKFPEILDSVVVGQDWENDVRIILFVMLANNQTLTEELKNSIRTLIRKNTSSHHVPAKIIQVLDIPKTMSGKTVELAIRETIHNRPVNNLSSIANPEALEYFKNLAELDEK